MFKRGSSETENMSEAITMNDSNTVQNRDDWLRNRDESIESIRDAMAHAYQARVENINRNSFPASPVQRRSRKGTGNMRVFPPCQIAEVVTRRRQSTPSPRIANVRVNSDPRRTSFISIKSQTASNDSSSSSTLSDSGTDVGDFGSDIYQPVAVKNDNNSSVTETDDYSTENEDTVSDISSVISEPLFVHRRNPSVLRSRSSDRIGHLPPIHTPELVRHTRSNSLHMSPAARRSMRSQPEYLRQSSYTKITSTRAYRDIYADTLRSYSSVIAKQMASAGYRQLGRDVEEIRRNKMRKRHCSSPENFRRSCSDMHAGILRAHAGNIQHAPQTEIKAGLGYSSNCRKSEAMLSRSLNDQNLEEAMQRKEELERMTEAVKTDARRVRAKSREECVHKTIASFDQLLIVAGQLIDKYKEVQNIGTNIEK